MYFKLLTLCTKGGEKINLKSEGLVVSENSSISRGLQTMRAWRLMALSLKIKKIDNEYKYIQSRHRLPEQLLNRYSDHVTN